MKITEENVYVIEHNLINNLLLTINEETSDTEARDLTMYINGVNDMASAIINTMRKLKNV